MLECIEVQPFWSSQRLVSKVHSCLIDVACGLPISVVIQTWKDELHRSLSAQPLINCELTIHRHLKPGCISYCEYYGPDRAKLFNQLTSYDVVITTFSVVRLDWKLYSSSVEEKPTLHALDWHRIILDEGMLLAALMLTMLIL